MDLRSRKILDGSLTWVSVLAIVLMTLALGVLLFVLVCFVSMLVLFFTTPLAPVG